MKPKITLALEWGGEVQKYNIELDSFPKTSISYARHNTDYFEKSRIAFKI